LDPRKSHVKHWRPQILLFMDNPTKKHQRNLLEFANYLKKGGLYIVGDIIVGKLEEKKDEYMQKYHAWQELIDKLELKAFASTVISPSALLGVEHLVMTCGIGVMKPNIIMFGFPEMLKRENNDLPRSYNFERVFDGNDGPPISASDYLSFIHTALHFNKSVILARHFDKMNIRRIKDKIVKLSALNLDLWPIFFEPTPHNSMTKTLIMMFGHILSSECALWKKTNLRVFSCVMYRSEIEAEQIALKSMFAELRISCEAKVLHLLEDQGAHQEMEHLSQHNATTFRSSRLDRINTLMRQQSEVTDLVITSLPKVPRGVQDAAEFMEELQIFTDSLPPTLLVFSQEYVVTNSI